MMDERLKKYNCAEYFEEYYSNGMFRPREAYSLFPYKNAVLEEGEGYMQIGGIWDDLNSKICYRESEKGVWGRYNYSGKYFLLSETLKELVEGWYPHDRNYWAVMGSEEQWREIRDFYKVEIERYNWDSLDVLDFVNQGIDNGFSKGFYLKAFNNHLEISSINGFLRRPNTKMVIVQFEREIAGYHVHYKDDFFKENFSKKIGKEQIELMMESIKDWIKN